MKRPSRTQTREQTENGSAYLANTWLARACQLSSLGFPLRGVNAVRPLSVGVVMIDIRSITLIYLALSVDDFQVLFFGCSAVSEGVNVVPRIW